MRCARTWRLAAWLLLAWLEPGVAVAGHAAAALEADGRVRLVRGHGKKVREVAGFILVAEQRSGTHWVTQELNRHPCITAESELFFRKRFDINWTSELRQRAVRAFFAQDKAETQGLPAGWNDVLRNNSRLAREGRVVRGFNWKVNQGFLDDWRPLRAFLAGRRVRVLWLRRANFLRRIFSNEANKVQALSATSSPAEAREAREAKVRVETKTLIQQLHQEEKQLKTLSDLFRDSEDVDVLPMFYENMSHSFSTLRHFLLDNSTCTTGPDVLSEEANGLVKLHPGRLEELVGNWPELERTLKGTQWEWMLYD